MEIQKWQYFRDEVPDLKALDDKLLHLGNLGWELVSVIHTRDSGNTASENILAPEVWVLIVKQPVSPSIQ